MLSDPLSLLILDRTHLLIGTDASEYYFQINEHDRFYGIIIALIEIKFNRSSLDLFVISYELIDLSDIKYLNYQIDHIPLSMSIYGNILIGLLEVNLVRFVDLDMNEQRLISNNRTFSMQIQPKLFGYISICC